MGHENVGTIVEAGPRFVERQGLGEGARVFVEHYVACYQCEWCRVGEYRHCEATDWRTNPDARRYGYTTCENPYHLWAASRSTCTCPGTPSCTGCRTASPTPRPASSRRFRTESNGPSTTAVSAS